MSCPAVEATKRDRIMWRAHRDARARLFETFLLMATRESLLIFPLLSRTGCGLVRLRINGSIRR